MAEEEQFKPFIIGIVDGGLTNHIIKQIENHLESYPICTISMTDYYKDMSPNEEDYIKPELIDFALLQSDLVKIKNQEPCEIPIYNLTTRKRSSEKKKIEPKQIVIVEGLFCFYEKILNDLIDLKIFIDTDNDIRLARTISKEIAKGKPNPNLIDIIQKFHKYIKPAYDNFISRTKRDADIILPNATGNETAIKIITNYLKLILDDISKNKAGPIFSFQNKIVDPKYIFYHDKITTKNQNPDISFLKDIFQDFTQQTLDEEFIEVIRKKLIDMILSMLNEPFMKNGNEPKFEKILFDSDDITNMDFETGSNNIYFKTAILTENDMNKPKEIFSKNKDCKIYICSVFLSPKIAQNLIGKGLNSMKIYTLYFSDFFVKYEGMIKKDETIFQEQELEKLFKQML